VPNSESNQRLDSSASAPFTDFPTNGSLPFLRLWIPGAFLGLYIAGVVLTAASDDKALLVGAIVLLGAGIVSMLYVVPRVVRIRVRKALSRHPHAPLGLLADVALREADNYGPSQGVCALATYLAEGGRLGCALRFCPENVGGVVEPILLPFEPRPLDEADLALLALAEAGTEDTAGSLPAADCRSGCAGDQVFRTVRRRVRRSGGLFIACLSVLQVFSLAYQAHDFVQTGRVSAVWVALSVLALAILLGLEAAVYRSREWLAVPGGLVMRKARLLRTRWQVLVFNQHNSVVCISPIVSSRWQLLVADGRKVHATAVTKSEAEFALRAWLSPLPPPSPDQLTDLQ
jgi:hypothetical protein